MERERVRHQELEQRLMEAKLRQQQLQSEEDSRWLRQEESNLVNILLTRALSLSIDCISFLQKKRLSITQSFGSEHSDSSERLTDSPSLAAPLVEKDRSSTPGSSGGEERHFIVKVRSLPLFCPHPSH